MKVLCLFVALVLGVSGIGVPTLRVTRHPASTTVQRGERADLYCAGEADDGSAVSVSWRRIVSINNLTPVLESISTGADGHYVLFNATTSAFYFCVIDSVQGNFQTTSNGAFVEVSYLDDFSGSSTPTVEVSDPTLFVELECAVPASNPYPSVTWLKHDVPISSEEKMIMRRNSLGQPSNLVIYDIGAADSGVYHCELDNPASTAGTRKSDTITLTIQTSAATMGVYAPQEVVPDYTYTAKQGDSVELHVGMACKPEVVYTWEKNVELTTEGDARYTFSDFGRTLKIDDLTAADDGAYLVRYTQSGSVMGSTTVILNVIVPITAEGDVWDFSTVLGEPMVLTSGCQGSPPSYLMFETTTPGALWYKDGTLLENTTAITVHRDVAGKQNGVVTIHSVTDSDTGTYVAACFNENAYKSFTKNVLITNDKQAITMSADKGGWGLVGSTVTIACTAEGTPRPTVEWIKGIGGTPVRSGEFPRTDFTIDYTYTMFKTIATLVVSNAENADSGMFECKASYTVRGVEYSATETSELIVAIPTSPRIKCMDVLVEEGTAATLACAFSGVPLPDLNYRIKNESSLEEIIYPGAAQNNLSLMVIPNVPAEASGMYRTDATNVAGDRFDTLTLSISPASTRMSMNAIIGISVLVAFLLIGGLILAILLGRWKREKDFNDEMDRLIKERKDEVADLQLKLQLRSMENRPGVINNPLHQLPETRRQLPSFYAANIAVLAATPSAKTLPPSLAALRKQRRAGTGIDSVIHERTVSPSSVRTIMSPADVEEPGQ